MRIEMPRISFYSHRREEREDEYDARVKRKSKPTKKILQGGEGKKGVEPADEAQKKKTLGASPLSLCKDRALFFADTKKGRGDVFYFISIGKEYHQSQMKCEGEEEKKEAFYPHCKGLHLVT